MKDNPVTESSPSAHTEISLCLIVRNEEANLRACLLPVMPLFDEVVVVDTGSADRSKAVAEELGAKVFDFAWCDDFSAARNFALEQAQGKWIFWLDADDRLSAETRERLADLLDQLRSPAADNCRRAYVMTTVSSSRHSTEPATLISHTRLFRKDERVRWTGRVHEQITPALEAIGDELVHTDWQVEHLGYLDPALCQRKANRDLRLLRMDYATNPEDPATLFLLGTTYLRTGQAHQALAHLLKSLQQVKSRGDWVRRLYALIVETLSRLGRREEAFGFTTEALVSFPADVEIMTRRAELLCDFGDLIGAEQTLLELLRAPRATYLLHGASTYHDGREARALLGRIYREMQRFEQAEQAFQELLAEYPAWIPAWVNLGYGYLMQLRWGDVEYVAKQLEKCELGDPYALVLRAEAKVARGDLKAARELVEKAIMRAPQLAWARIVLSDILLRDGTNKDACIAVQRDILRLNPGNPQALRNLELLTANTPPAQPTSWPLGWSITVNP